MRHRNVAGPESDLRKGNRVSAEDGRGLYTFTDCEMSICRSAQLASYTGEYEPQICHVPPGCSQVRGFQNTQINENFFLLFVQQCYAGVVCIVLHQGPALLSQFNLFPLATDRYWTSPKCRTLLHGVV